MALPCPALPDSVYTENNKTKIGLIKPVQMLAGLSQDVASTKIAKEVEEETMKMIKGDLTIRHPMATETTNITERFIQ